jgi:hypothetical protein
MNTVEDPDLLHLRCRDPNARQLILEAIRSHQAGAQRAAIVSIWIAVVYDIFGKLRELAQTGEPNAQAAVVGIDRAVDEHDIVAAQRVESTALQLARDKFGLLSANEYMDLERLYDDRHRCAHPSLNRPEEMYVPSAELVRLHLRNAVEHLLSQPPVQGRAALVRLQQEVDSDLFPKRTVDAAEYLRAGIYRRMKAGLIRDFCVAAAASCLCEAELERAQFERRVRGINALRSISPDIVNQALKDKLPGVARRVPDGLVHRIVRFCAAVSDSAQRLGQDVQMRVLTHIEHAPMKEFIRAIQYALLVPEFADAARVRVGELTHAALKYILAHAIHEETLDTNAPAPELFDRVVEMYVDSGSWNTSNVLAKTLVVPYAFMFSPENISDVLRAFPLNQDLFESSTRNEVLRALAATERANDDELDAALAQCGLERSDIEND